MASNQFDATLKLVYLADQNTFFASDTVTKGAAFDVVGNVEIGKELMEQVESEKLYISVVNQSKAKVLLTGEKTNALKKSEQPYNAELRVSFHGGWAADEGDVLEVVASYRVSTGLFTDYSTLRSLPVVVAVRPI